MLLWLPFAPPFQRLMLAARGSKVNRKGQTAGRENFARPVGVEWQPRVLWTGREGEPA